MEFSSDFSSCQHGVQQRDSVSFCLEPAPSPPSSAKHRLSWGGKEGHVARRAGRTRGSQAAGSLTSPPPPPPPQSFPGGEWALR